MRGWLMGRVPTFFKTTDRQPASGWLRRFGAIRARFCLTEFWRHRGPAGFGQSMGTCESWRSPKPVGALPNSVEVLVLEGKRSMDYLVLVPFMMEEVLGKKCACATTHPGRRVFD